MLNKGVHWEGLKKGEMPNPVDEGDAFEKKFKSLTGHPLAFSVELHILEINAFTIYILMF